MADDNEGRLARIEKKLDELLTQFHKLENSDTRQEVRLDQLESRVDGHGATLKRCFERLDDIEGRPAKAALQMWQKIGGIVITVIVTAIVTYILIYLGIEK
jgi:hypothetical protein